MLRLEPWLALIRFEEYGPFFILCALVGSIAGGGFGNPRLLVLLVFVAAFSASAFVENDIIDVAEDLRKKSNRNPIAAGLIPQKGALVMFALLAGVSLVTLASLGSSVVVTGILALGLYWSYSWGPKLKSVPVIDVVVHGAVPATFVLMGSEIAGQVGPSTLLIALVAFLFAVMAGLLQQVRDLDADRGSGRTSAMALGASKSIEVCLGLAVMGVATFASLPVEGILPLGYLVFVPAGYFLVRPLLRLCKSPETAPLVIVRVRSLGLLLAILLVLAYPVLAWPLGS